MQSRPKTGRNRTHRRRALRAAIALGGALIVTSAAHAATLFVKPGGGGLQNGSSWINAFANPQLALAQAQPLDQIWVAAGTYKPTTSTTDQTATFALKRDVKMYGGFVGVAAETLLEHRNPLVNLTYLSGDINAGEINDDGLDPGNSIHVVSAVRTCTGGGGEPCECTPEITHSTQLDGFIITMGYADTPSGEGYGGGMFILGASPVIQNCVFIGNHANKGGGAYVGQSLCPPDARLHRLSSRCSARAASWAISPRSTEVDSRSRAAPSWIWSTASSPATQPASGAARCNSAM
jgi:hypothetical protein